MRYKEFNRNTVLEKCISLFWNDSYRATSIKKIVDITGVNRFSLYAEFVDKEGILQAAVKLYLERYAYKYIEVFEQQTNGKQALLSFFHSYFKESKKHPPGCFLIATSTELFKTNAFVTLELDNYLKQLNKAFVKWAIQNNSIDSEKKASQLVGLFCSAMSICVILTEAEFKDYLEKNLNVILENEYSYV